MGIYQYCLSLVLSAHGRQDFGVPDIYLHEVLLHEILQKKPERVQSRLKRLKDRYFRDQPLLNLINLNHLS